MKKLLYLSLILSCITLLDAKAQWTFNTKGNQYNVNSITANTAGTISLTSTGGGVKSTVTPQGLLVTAPRMLMTSDNTYNLTVLNTGVESALNSVPIDKWFKAKTGKNETIQINYQYRKTTPANNNANPTQTNNFTTNFKVVVGSKETHSPYQNFTTVPTQVSETQNGNTVTGIFRAIINFPVGSTKGYVVIPIMENITNFALICSRSLPPVCTWNTENLENVIILPFIVEGASIDLTAPDAVGIAGYTKEPAIPYMILHAPPGDNSNVTFEQNQETCRSFSETVQDDLAANGRLDIKLGIAGNAGFIVTTNFEFSVTASVTAGGGNTQIKRSDTKTCINAISSISTLTKASGVSDGTIYMGYSSDLAYGYFPRVIITSSNPLVIKKDTALIFATVGPPNPFYWSKQQIINDIAIKKAIVDAYVPSNPVNEQALSLANHALNQIKVWRQVLTKDSANVANPQNNVIRSTYAIGGDQSTTESISYAGSTTYDVNHYISAGAGASFVVNVGGSGISGGAEFTTKKTYGEAIANTTNSTSSIKWRLYDDDITGEENITGERIRVKIVRDPDYGTPIFLLDSANSRTSAPYEGGYRRDQPWLRFLAAPNDLYYTVPNVAVGITSQFGVKLCNKSDEERSYNLRFDPFTNANNVIVSLTGSTGKTEFGSFPVPANACLPNTYFINIKQENIDALTSQAIKLQLYAAEEAKIISNIFVTSNWGNYALPSNLTSSSSVVCPGSPVSLSAFCPAGTVTWYNREIGGTVLGTGSTITQTPTTNTDYYVACQADIYNYPTVKAASISIPKFVFPTLNLTSNFTANSLQVANTTLMASNKVISPAKVTYLAGNSLTFKPGFEAKSGSSFEAKIGGCPNLNISGLVAYYPFNGNANDESGNGNNGTANGATLTADRFGNAGKAYAFDGIDDQISGAANRTMYSANKTISLWAVISGSGDSNPRIFGVGPAGSSGQYYGLVVAGNTSPRQIQFYTQGSVADGYSNTRIPNGTVWRNFVATYDGSKVKIYINGVLDSETNTNGLLVDFTTAVLQIGYSDNGLDRFNGKLDDIRVYNRALSNTEVQSIYNAEKP